MPARPASAPPQSARTQQPTLTLEASSRSSKVGRKGHWEALSKKGGRQDVCGGRDSLASSKLLKVSVKLEMLPYSAGREPGTQGQTCLQVQSLPPAGCLPWPGVFNLLGYLSLGFPIFLRCG